MNEKTIKALKPIAAMVCITVIEGFAIYSNINGVLLSAVVAVLAGLGGYTFGRRRE